MSRRMSWFCLPDSLGFSDPSGVVGIHFRAVDPDEKVIGHGKDTTVRAFAGLASRMRALELSSCADLARHICKAAPHPLRPSIFGQGRMKVEPQVLENARRLQIPPAGPLVAELVLDLSSIAMAGESRAVIRQFVVGCPNRLKALLWSSAVDGEFSEVPSSMSSTMLDACASHRSRDDALLPSFPKASHTA